MTSFQLTAARCQRNYLREFTATAIVEKFETMRKEFVPNVELLLIETEHFDEISTEKCVYCDEIIDIGKFVCANEHKLPRCCISMVQVIYLFIFVLLSISNLQKTIMIKHCFYV